MGKTFENLDERGTTGGDGDRGFFRASCFLPRIGFVSLICDE